MPSRRLRHRALAPVTAAVTTLAAAALCCASSAAAHRPHVGVVSKPKARLYVVEHAVTDTEIPVAKGGKDEKGDPLTFVNPIFGPNDTTRIGHDEGYCLRLDPVKGVWECSWTTFVKGGSIMVQGPFYDTRDSVMTITGGTGRYADARGEMYLSAFDHGKKFHFDFELVG